MIYKEFILRSSEGEKLRADIRYLENGIRKPVVIFIHGFKGFKDWGPFLTVRERLASSGFICIGFNFSHNGIGDDPDNFTELDRFADNTISRERDELSDVINEIVHQEHLPISENEVNPDSIGLLGHSRGASVAILQAPHHRMIRAVAAWSSPAYFNRYSERQQEEWRNKGYFEIQNSRTGQIMRLNVDLLNDIEKNKERLDILSAAKLLTSQEKFLYLVTGSEDLTVNPKESQSIYDATVKEFAKYEIILHTGHTFGSEHPKREIPAPLETVLEMTSKFFTDHLILHPVPFPE